LFVKNDGTLWAMGSNGSGRLGDGTTTSRNSPVQIASNVLAASAGGSHSLFCDSVPVIESQPADVGVVSGSTAALGIVATGPGTLTFQWYLGTSGDTNSPIAGQTEMDLETSTVTEDMEFWVRATNAAGSADSRTVTVRVVTRPVVTGLTESPENGTLSVAATGGMLSYQWFEGQPGDVSAPVTSATGPVFLSRPITNPTAFWVRVSNASGSADSVAAVVSTAPPVPANLRAAGSAAYGQLGTGAMTAWIHPAPVGGDIADVAVSASHVLFLKTDGTLWAAGSNQHGQLGDGSTIGRSRPVMIASEVSSIAASSHRSLFVKTDGALWTVGRNANGELADGTTTNRPTPVQVDAEVFAASAGGSHSLWLTSNSAIPVTTIADHPPSAWIEPGATANLTVDARGEALSYQWYRGLPGDMGNPLPDATAATFTTTAEGAFWVRATGANGSADSRAGRVTFIDPPAITTQPSLVAHEPGGGVTLAAIASDAWSYQWFAGPAGDESQPLAGATRVTLLTRPVIATTSFWVRATNPAGSADSLSVTVEPPAAAGRFLFAAGQRFGSSNPVLLSGAVTTAATGSNHGLFVTTDGTLWAVGQNTNGQLGTGNTVTAATPVRVAENVTAVAAGSDHSLLIRSDGSLWAMGRSTNGQLGTGSGLGSLTPQRVANEVSAIAAGSNHSMLIKTDGSLWAMGFNSSGQLGDGSTTDRHLPEKIADHVAMIAGGGGHSLFVTTGSGLWAMGSNSSGQLGISNNSAQLLPVPVTDGVVAIVAGGSHSLLVRIDGSLWGMGRNVDSELVIGGNASAYSRSQFHSFNVPVLMATDVTTAAAGSSHSLFVKRGGTMWATGRNSNRQLIVQTNPNTPMPVEAHPNVHAISASGNNTFYLATAAAGDPPAILDHPQSVFLDPGESASLTVSAAGSGPLSYQWFKGRPGDMA
jgi:alpha-tubulin suppressor-like RCC1 family protein